MSTGPILAALGERAARAPRSIAIQSESGTISYGALADAVQAAAENLRTSAPRVIGLAVDNGPVWAMADLAAMQAGVPIVPLPFFFSPGQVLHAVRDAGIDCIYTDQPQFYEALLADAGIDLFTRDMCEIFGQQVVELRLRGTRAELPAGTIKVTYTSGTTGSPKGVCLGLPAIASVAQSLAEATQANAADHHVSLLPLSTLLENIAGLYVPLLAGASCALLPFEQIGLKGASGLNVQKMADALCLHAATSTILTPEMLRALVAATAAGHPLPPHLRFVAVGGAPVSDKMLGQAHALGIPVFEGYGLSECASVVALNTEHAARIGSVGRPLPHAKLRFADDGEILVAGATLLGYAGASARESVPEYWPSGDLGYLDAEGYLHLTGRKKNVFITSFGRNVAPEWVERELALYPCIAQSAVFGEARPWNVAVIVPRGSVQEIDAAIRDANGRLPDYARIRRWLPADAPFTPQAGTLTPNGRLRRDAILAAYLARIDDLYEEATDVVL